MKKEEVKKFRVDFQNAVAQLEKQYGVNISLGTIRFDAEGLRSTMTASKGIKVARIEATDFRVGDTVGINHKSIGKTDLFEVKKINNKSIKVQRISQGYLRGSLINVSPGLLIKK